MHWTYAVTVPTFAKSPVFPWRICAYTTNDMEEPRIYAPCGYTELPPLLLRPIAFLTYSRPEKRT